MAIATERQAREAELERRIAALAAEVVDLSFDLIALMAARGCDVSALAERVAGQSLAVLLAEWDKLAP